MARIRTVLGDIEADGLGLVYAHEHLLTDPPAVQRDRDLELSSYECSLRELTIFREHGGTLLGSRRRCSTTGAMRPEWRACRARRTCRSSP